MQLSQTMADALSNLSEGERQAIALSYYKGYTYREVAEILGQPEGTVKSRIRSAMTKLKTSLQDSISEEVQS
jgi:RNA polymerase sigma-70 factor (ECF subfamily)